jgi:NADPH:quinone reductase-like Zn-dependent oxidoreductase
VASAANHALARRLGAVAVIDYRKQPVEGTYDVIMDVIGTLPWARAVRHLAPGGRLLLITADLLATLGATFRPGRDGCRLIAGTSSESLQMMQRLVALHHAGAYRPVVSLTLAFGDLARAHALAETFHKPGNLVVVMSEAGAQDTPVLALK